MKHVHGIAALSVIGALTGCPTPTSEPDSGGPRSDTNADANLSRSFADSTDDVVWRDLATDGSRLYAAGYDAEGLMGGVIVRTIVIAAYEGDGSLAWRHELGRSSGIANAVEVDADGTVWFAGELSRDVTLGSVALTEIGDDDVFVLAVTRDGEAMRGWVAGGMDKDHADALTIGPDGPVVAGAVAGTVDLGAGPVVAGEVDASIFVAAWDRLGAPRWSHVYTVEDGEIDAEEIDVAPSGRVVLIGDLGEVRSVSLGGAPLENVDGSFVLELGADGAFERSWALDPTNTAEAYLRGVVALDDSSIFLGSFGESLTLGGTTLTTFGASLAERCVSMPADPDCPLLEGGAWTSWQDTFVARLDGPETLRWSVVHAGLEPNEGARDLEADGEAVLAAVSRGRVQRGASAREASVLRITQSGDLASSSETGGSEITAHAGGAVTSDSTGEGGILPGMHATSTLRAVTLTP
ncbi:MAG: hypothetical protein J0L92_36540 [Deltaproteobacteria bacterium]|nr:hypothetical protein [Deltaproteobacteria bacterium]